MTAESCCCAGISATTLANAARSAASHATTRTWAPAASSSATSSPAPGASATAPAQQDQVARTVAGHRAARQRRTRHPGAAGDQHGARCPRVRHHHHDLADMTGLTQYTAAPPAPDGCRTSSPATAAAPRRRTVRPNRACTGASGGRPGSNRSRRGSGQCQGTPRAMTPGSRMRPGLTHLQEDPAGRDQPQRGVHEFTGQGVQHHIEAAPTGHRPELVLELQAPYPEMCSSSKPMARNVSHLPRLAVTNTSRPRCRRATAPRPCPPRRRRVG